MHRSDAPVVGHAGAYPHEDRVPAAMRIEDFFSRERALDRTARQDGELAHDDLVCEGIGLAAESATVSGSDDANAIHRKLEDLAQRSVDVVHDLRRRPESQLSIDIGCDCAVLLHRQVRVALVEEDVLADVLCAREATVNVAELE
jgi:hypothetical protein